MTHDIVHHTLPCVATPSHITPSHITPVQSRLPWHQHPLPNANLVPITPVDPLMRSMTKKPKPSEAPEPRAQAVQGRRPAYQYLYGVQRISGVMPRWVHGYSGGYPGIRVGIPVPGPTYQAGVKCYSYPVMHFGRSGNICEYRGNWHNGNTSTKFPIGGRVTQEADAFAFCTPVRSPAYLR